MTLVDANIFELLRDTAAFLKRVPYFSKNLTANIHYKKFYPILNTNLIKFLF